MRVVTLSKLFTKWKSNVAETLEDRGAAVAVVVEDAVAVVVEDAVVDAVAAVAVALSALAAVAGTAIVGVEEDAAAIVIRVAMVGATKAGQTTSAVIPVINRKVRTEDLSVEGTMLIAALIAKADVTPVRTVTTTVGKHQSVGWDGSRAVDSRNTRRVTYSSTP